MVDVSQIYQFLHLSVTDVDYYSMWTRICKRRRCFFPISRLVVLLPLRWIRGVASEGVS